MGYIHDSNDAPISVQELNKAAVLVAKALYEDIENILGAFGPVDSNDPDVKKIHRHIHKAVKYSLRRDGPIDDDDEEWYKEAARMWRLIHDRLEGK